MRINKYILLAISIIFLFVGACTKTEGNDDTERIKKQDDEILKNYLKDKSIEAEKTSSGLYYHISREGNGVHPDKNSTVTVRYKGYLANGDIFDQTGSGSAATFPLSGVILGWQEGIPFFSENGVGQLFIPSHLAYGKRGSRNIPPNTPLIFDITLSDVK